MKYVTIFGAGGPAGILLSRCLRGIPDIDLSGWDDSPWARCLMEVDTAPDREMEADLLLPVPDVLIPQPHSPLRRGLKRNV